jgi:hypothetical protein
MDPLPTLIKYTVVLVISAYVFIGGQVLARRQRPVDLIIWWPIFLYIPGPLAVYLLFSDTEVFATYFTEQSVFAATIILIASYGIYHLSLGARVARQLSRDISIIETSPLAHGSTWSMFLLGLACVFLQLMLIRATGASILSDAYILGNGNFEENSTLFTATAGLYEIFGALLALKYVGKKFTLRDDGLFALFALFVVALRTLGGTRLIVLKLVLFIMLIQFIRRKIDARKTAIITCISVFVFAVVGALRGGSGTGVVFLLLAEPALSNLSSTYVTQFYIEKGIFFPIASIWNGFSYLLFVLIHLLPNSIYRALGGDIVLLGDWGYYRSWAAAFYPFREILRETGLDTISPVGGQSIVALGVALFGVAGGALLLPMIYGGFSLLRDLIPRKMPLMLIVGFEAPSIFRDPTEIMVKQVMIVAIAYAAFCGLCRLRIGLFQSVQYPTPNRPVHAQQD